MKKLIVLTFALLLTSACATNTSKKKDSSKSDKAKVEASEKEKKSKSKDIRKTECKLGTDIRIIEIKEAGSGFEVLYTKSGEEKSVATGGREHCEGIRERIKTNLTNAGFTCS